VCAERLAASPAACCCCLLPPDEDDDARYAQDEFGDQPFHDHGYEDLADAASGAWWFYGCWPLLGREACLQWLSLVPMSSPAWPACRQSAQLPATRVPPLPQARARLT
jgi:hypothetical protein